MSVTDERFAPELVLKATPPRIPRGSLTRARLAISSPELADRSVLLVQAPAGFGKTSLLGQWRRECLSGGAIVVWLTLDAQDDCARLARALTVSLRSSSGRSGLRPGAPGLFGPTGDELELLTQWLAEVAAMAAETVLILDEGQSLSEATVTQSLTYLIRNAPANLRIVIASRRRLSLPVAELTAQGHLATVTTEQMRFSLEETAEVLGTRFGTRVDADACARLHDTTEGWPLGLQLIVATIERSPRLKAAIDSLGAHSQNFESFFADTLLAPMPVELAGSLVRLAPLGALHPQLCAAIVGRESATALLEYLRNETPILSETDDGEWVRIHPLAREFLLGRFERLAESEQHEIHAVCAKWLAACGMFEDAGRHAFLAGDSELACEMAGHCMRGTLLRGQWSLVLEWLDRLPPSAIERRPQLRIALGWALSMSRQNEKALAMVAPLLADPRTDAHTLFEARIISSGAHFFADDIEAACQQVRAVGPLAPEQSEELRTAFANQQAAVALYEGAPEKARQLLRGLGAGGPELRDSVSGYRDWTLGHTYLWEGHYGLAGDSLEQSLARSEASMGRRSPIATLIAVTLAAVLCEREQPAAAVALMANRADLVERFATPEIVTLWAVVAARTAVQDGHEDLALNHLEHLCAQGESQRFPRMCVYGLAEQIRIHAYHGRAETCDALRQRLDGLTPADARAGRGMLGAVLGLEYHLAHAHAAIALWDLERAARMLDKADALARRLQRGREIIESKLLRALLAKLGGGDGNALLGEAIGLARTYGLGLVLSRTHRDLTEWVRRVQPESGQQVGGAPAPQPGSSAPPVPQPRPAGSRPAVAASALLTEKEQEILQLLSRHMSNKEIGLALGIGEETVKWHLKNLFAKLGAGTRKHAVGRARLLGVLIAAD